MSIKSYLLVHLVKALGTAQISGAVHRQQLLGILESCVGAKIPNICDVISVALYSAFESVSCTKGYDNSNSVHLRSLFKK